MHRKTQRPQREAISHPWPNDPGFAFPFVLGKVPNAQVINWINISQANPNTVQSLSFDPLRCYSDLEGSFEGGGTGFKGILKFANPVSIGGSSVPVLFDMGQLEPVSSGVEYNFSMTLDSTYAFYADLAVRVRAITSTFNVGALTWTNVVTSPTLTFSSNPLYNGRAVSCSFSATTPSPHSAQTFSLQGNFPGSQFASTTQNDNFTFAYYAPGTARETVYGALIECAPISSIPLAATVTQSQAVMLLYLGVAHSNNKIGKIIVP